MLHTDLQKSPCYNFWLFCHQTLSAHDIIQQEPVRLLSLCVSLAAWAAADFTGISPLQHETGALRCFSMEETSLNQQRNCAACASVMASGALAAVRRPQYVSYV